MYLKASGSVPLWNIPNVLTVFRVLLIPVFVIIYCLPVSWANSISCLIFTLAALTDWLDGFLARKLKQTTRLGAFLDPVADKLIVVAALILLVYGYATLWLALPALIIVIREIVISALREWMAEIGKITSVAVSYIGKIKTAAQMASIAVLLFFEPKSSDHWVLLGYGLMYLSVALTIWSMALYLKAAWPELKKT